MHFPEYDQWTRLTRAVSSWNLLPGFGTEEVQTLDKTLSTQYCHISTYNGDPLRRVHPKHRYVESIDKDPVFTLLDIGPGYIDAAMIGPVDRVIEMLTSDARLMAAARGRAFCGPAMTYGFAMLEKLCLSRMRIRREMHWRACCEY